MSESPSIAATDVEKVRRFVIARSNDSFVHERSQRNVDGQAPSFSREHMWYVLLGCLLTTQQRSTIGAPVDRFLETVPFPLSLAECRGDVKRVVETALTKFGGIRMAPTISARAQANHRWLEAGGWTAIERQFATLARQRDRQPLPADKVMEREAARFAAAELEGIGPKQSRNLWQWLGLTRYEIPLDSRVADWINRNLSMRVNKNKLTDHAYYETVLDYVQEMCERAGVLPCIFDAAAFDYTKSAAAKAAGSRDMSGHTGTTRTGYVNPNGQVTIRNTGRPGTDHLQSVYQLTCSHCGNNYGANGSDIHERKCPMCQGGQPGLTYGT